MTVTTGIKVHNFAEHLLKIELDDIWELARLKNHHRDPFDRLLISQAIVEDISILSDDRLFDRYPVKRLW
jgi:PIN domain nuclease of toxin-antitoxin system